MYVLADIYIITLEALTCDCTKSSWAIIKSSGQNIHETTQFHYISTHCTFESIRIEVEAIGKSLSNNIEATFGQSFPELVKWRECFFFHLQINGQYIGVGLRWTCTGPYTT